MKKITLTLTMALLPLSALAEIVIENAWARATPPRAMSGAAYVTIQNMGDVADALIEASSPAAKRVEIHRTTEDENGMMSMDHMEKVVLNKKSYVKMEPGDLHIMLMGLNYQLKEGKEIPVTLKFEHAPEMTVRVEVKPITHRE